MSVYSHLWRILQILLATIITAVTQELDSQEISDATKSSTPYPLFLPVTYQVWDAEYFLLKEAGQDIMRNSSMQSHTQPFVMLQAGRLPVINASYGPLSTKQEIPPGLSAVGAVIPALTTSFHPQLESPVLYPDPVGLFIFSQSASPVLRGWERLGQRRERKKK
ncbi:transmembrane protein 132D-like [Megalobrama amblycephala]|uniref:transmembrane protein 132D-like n=1 Tax=Megalobrama amblycephala TaxID=75352 RepID=UPI00201482DC|nr:transmembrane protein 132D-like [Megalobrama amblycephala]